LLSNPLKLKPLLRPNLPQMSSPQLKHSQQLRSSLRRTPLPNSLTISPPKLQSPQPRPRPSSKRNKRHQLQLRTPLSLRLKHLPLNSQRLRSKQQPLKRSSQPHRQSQKLRLLRAHPPRMRLQ